MRCFMCGRILKNGGKCECGANLKEQELLYPYAQEEEELKQIAELLSVKAQFEVQDGVLVKYRDNGEKEVSIPEGVIEIGKGAFEGCRSLERIEIPSSVRKIGESAFMDCKRLEEINLSEGVVEVGQGAFFLCMNLKKIKLPNSVRKIGRIAFCLCGLEEIRLPEGVIEVEKGAFADCKSLKKMEVSNSVKMIGEDVFAGCTEKLVIHYEGGRSQWERITSECNVPDYVKVLYKWRR